MAKPTDEQIKEFWDECGAEVYGYFTKMANGDLLQSPVPIDLNNLFKHAFGVAVRKLIDEHNYAESYAIETIMKSWMLGAREANWGRYSQC